MKTVREKAVQLIRKILSNTIPEYEVPTGSSVPPDLKEEEERISKRQHDAIQRLQNVELKFQKNLRKSLRG
jgi:hypothetical protein